MSDDRLAEIKARLAAATPGPRGVVPYMCREAWYHVYADVPNGEEIATANTYGDAEFIAHAPADIAWLVVENAALRARLDKWDYIAQHGHDNPCTLGPLCPYCEIERLRDADGLCASLAADCDRLSYENAALRARLVVDDAMVERAIEAQNETWERGMRPRMRAAMEAALGEGKP